MSGTSLNPVRDAPVFLRSKAGMRWLLTLIVACTVFLVVYAYHNDAATPGFLQHLLHPHTKPDETSASQVDPQGSPPDAASPPSPPSPPHTIHKPPPQTLSHLPPWITTPAPFNTTQIPDYKKSTLSSLPNRPLALHPLLSTAMTRFLARPVLTHAQAQAQNEASCPRAQLNSQVNADQFQGEHEGWLSVDAARVVEMRLGALEWLEGRSQAEGEDALIGPGRAGVARGSRGIVLAAGNHGTVAKAIVCVRELQRLGWKGGGVEVFHFEGEMTDEKQRGELEGLGVTIRVVGDFFGSVYCLESGGGGGCFTSVICAHRTAPISLLFLDHLTSPECNPLLTLETISGLHQEDPQPVEEF